jgi:hypothetical protein
VTVNLPSLLSFDPLHQVSVEESEPEATGEGLRKVFTLRLQHFAVGPAEVPGFPLTWVGADGEVHTVDVPPKPFTVDALLANETEPQRRDEDPPISIEYPNTLAETVIYSALATLLVAMFAWLLWGRMRRRERPVVLPPPIAPHEQALGALRELENGELLAEGRFPSFYLELTEIAKGYMEGRFAIEALDRTTDEIRRELLRDTARIQPLSADEVVAFLQRCDLVKFARFEPDPEEAREALTRVRDMVERSMVVAKKPEAPVLPPDAPSARSPA